MQMSEAKIAIIKLFLGSMMLITTFSSGECHYKYQFKYPNYRLSRYIVPRHYFIDIHIHFMRDMIIYTNAKIEILEATTDINFHMLHLDMYYAYTTLFSENGTVYKPVQHIYQPQTHILNLHFKKEIPPGFYSLNMRHNRRLTSREDEKGILKISVSKKMRHRTSTLFATNFQPIEARQLFPCWDEPDLTASFQIHIHYKSSYRLWPRMGDLVHYNRIKHDFDGNQTYAQFSVRLNKTSTNNIAFALTDLKLEGYDRKQYYVIEGRSRLFKRLRFAQKIVLQTEQSTWFRKIALDVVEITQLVIPLIRHDIIGGWNLILYKESLIIYDKKLDTVAQQMEIARTISYAMVRQAINNAISPSWWSHAWLNEGLALFIRTEVVNEMFPGWRFMQLFVVQVQHESLRLDTKFSLKPLSHKVKTPFQIRSLFSFPFYIKAPVILRMVQHMIGSDNFQKVIYDYVRKYQFQSPQPDDLWDMMQIQTGDTTLYHNCNRTIKEIMVSWIKNNNFPVVRIYREGNELVINQYYFDDEDIVGEVSFSNWWIPITYTLSTELNFNNTTPRYCVMPKQNFVIPLKNDDDWIILNLQQTGYYRVKYDIKSLKLITSYLNSDKYQNIHVLNRAQIIDDTYQFWMKRRFTWYIFLKLTSYLPRDRDYIAWYPMFHIFRDLSRFLPLRRSDPIKNHMRNILNELLNKLTYNETYSEDTLTKSLRLEAARWACIFDDLRCQQIANTMLKKHLEDAEEYKLSPAWREWIYSKGWMIMDTSYLTTDALSFLNRTRLINYVANVKRHSRINGILFDAFFDKKIKHFTLIHYKIFVDYATERIEKIPEYLEKQSALIPDKVKIFYIIINNLYSKTEFGKLLVSMDKISWKGVTYRYIMNAMGRRLHQISLQKKRLIKLLKDEKVVD